MKRIYYGWYVVALTMVIYVCLTGFTFGAFGVFVLPVSAELMLSRADINTALIFKNLGNAIWAPIIGRSLDRIAVKPVMIVCSLIFAASFVVLGLSHSLWLGAFMMGVGIPIAYLGAGSLSNTLLIARWFKARRGRAMMLAGIGTSLGTMVAPPAAGYLVETFGWRMALIVIGLAIGAVLLLIALVIRDRPTPEDIAVELASTGNPEAAQPPGSPIGMLELIKTPHFWTMCLSTSMGFAASQAVNISWVPMGREAGLSMLEATSIVSVLGAAAIAGGLSISFFADRVNRVLLLAGLFVLEALVNAALAFDTSYPTLLACAATLGIVSGTVLATFYALLADRFGTASFGTVRGAAFFFNGALGMISVRFAGEVYDRMGSYHVMYLTFTAVYLAAAGLMLMSRFIRVDPAPAPA